MNELPPELVSQIVSHLHHRPLAPLAALSPAWRYAVESRTFSQLEITSSELGLFAQLFGATENDGGDDDDGDATPGRRAAVRRLRHSRVARRAFLRSLKVTIELPLLPSERRVWKLQGPRETAVNNGVFTREVLGLFSVLHSWDDGGGGEAGEHGSLELTLRALSPLDEDEPDDVDDHSEVGGYRVCDVRSFNRYLDFDLGYLPASAKGGAKVLPAAPVVSSFKMDVGRPVHPSFCAVLPAAVPSVTEMEWCSWAPPRRLPDLRIAVRNALAESLLLASAPGCFARLKKLHIFYDDSDPLDERASPGRLVPAADDEGQDQIPPSTALRDLSLSEDASSPSGLGKGRDPFTAALRSLSRLPALQRLELEGCHVVGPDLFDYGDGDDDVWRSLEIFTLHMAATTPDGRWYFTGDEARGSLPPWISRASGGEEDGDGDEDRDDDASAYDSADSDASDHPPLGAWQRRNGDVPQWAFRDTPNPDTLVPFLESLGRAVAARSPSRRTRFPKLRRLQVYITTMQHTGLAVEFFAPGPSPHFLEDGGSMSSDDEDDFQRRNAARPRWVLTSDYAIRPDGWDLPPRLRLALRGGPPDGDGEDEAAAVFSGAGTKGPLLPTTRAMF